MTTIKIKEIDIIDKEKWERVQGIIRANHRENKCTENHVPPTRWDKWESVAEGFSLPSKKARLIKRWAFPFKTKPCSIKPCSIPGMDLRYTPGVSTPGVY